MWNDTSMMPSHRHRAGSVSAVSIPLFLFSLIFILLLPSSATAQEPPYPDWRFGVVEAYEAPNEAQALGAAWTRVTFNWSNVQAGGPQEWSPPLSDEQLARELADGRLVVGLLIGIPQWARDGDGLPAGLWLEDDDAQNLWAGYVQRAVEQYQDRIDHWIIWNEPDIWDASAPGHTWDGDVGDFAQLQKVAYRVAKASNPAVVIHLPALTYYWDANYGREQYMDLLLAELAADPQAEAYNHFFDVATAHLYFQPAIIYDLLQQFQEIMAGHNLHKPFWLVETNAPPSNDSTWPVSDVTLSVLLDEQAAYMPQALASALAGGAQRIAIYKLKDIESDALANPEPFGLVRMSGSRRPGFTTYQVAVRYLAGTHSAERQRWDGVGQFLLDQGDFTTTVLFARLPQSQQAQVTATSEQAVLADMWGNRQTVTAADGVYQLDLPPALCSQSIGDYCMIGGTVYYLVQAKEGRSLPADLPAPAQSPTETPPPTAMPTATPSPTPSPSPTAMPTETPAAASATAEPAATLLPAAAIRSNEAAVSYPHTVTFRLELAPGQSISSAVLHYDVAQRSCVEVGSEVPVTPDGNTLEWTWVMSRSGNPPPGSELWWQWELRDEVGNTVYTPQQSQPLEDDRFQWRTVSNDGIHLHWYEGDSVGPALLEAAVAGLEQLEEEMGIELQEEVDIYIYANAAAMRQAILYVQDWAGGVAFSSYNTILIGVAPSDVEGWGSDTVRHELAHLVLGQFGWSCLGGRRPTWLEEGLATYAEGPASDSTLADINWAIEQDAFFPLRTLGGSFPAHGGDAGLAYSQSYSVVAFLLDDYGAQRLQELILLLAQGFDDDEALQQVYGFNVDGLEVAWRQAIGAAPRSIPATATPVSAAGVPTVLPLSAPGNVPTPASAAAAPIVSEPGAGICSPAFAPLLLLGLFGGVVQRRRRKRQ